jgi:drug/metabolite transporter (DMT)-like permease
MKPIVIVGIVVALLGAFAVFSDGLSFGTQRTVMRMGDMEVSAQDQRTIPVWIGGVALVGGLLMVGAGVLGRRS